MPSHFLMLALVAVYFSALGKTKKKMFSRKKMLARQKKMAGFFLIEEK